ncbi:hypothetical protein llap_2023 [Limosa lapponica baueri]|uniref:Uncharacterized protein n=1 Tax=Limosa lapponica baueri TaxID=1758121 RepID=A0A2I0UNR8_LIMLA|nr:hypothetical protein llap_2023 [Limosa lapponica baueri]
MPEKVAAQTDLPCHALKGTACGNMSHFCGAAEWEAANLDLITSLAIVFLCEHCPTHMKEGLLTGNSVQMKQYNLDNENLCEVSGLVTEQYWGDRHPSTVKPCSTVKESPIALR